MTYFVFSGEALKPIPGFRRFRLLAVLIGPLGPFCRPTWTLSSWSVLWGRSLDQCYKIRVVCCVCNTQPEKVFEIGRRPEKVFENLKLFRETLKEKIFQIKF